MLNPDELKEVVNEEGFWDQYLDYCYENRYEEYEALSKLLSKGFIIYDETCGIFTWDYIYPSNNNIQMIWYASERLNNIVAKRTKSLTRRRTFTSYQGLLKYHE